jgi:GR25 family glycosyltransferase involved in LPS biosynthesis
MKPEKVYIIRISTDVSRKYAEDAAASCEKLGIPYEFFEGMEGKSAYDAWMSAGVPAKMMGVYKFDKVDGSACATVSHARLWKKIEENRECAIILEHDALMLHKVDIDIPDNLIAVLGYKLSDPKCYDHKNAGAPQNIISINGHEGAHAYAITWKTARLLLDELNTVGVAMPIDNTFFLTMRRSAVPLGIVNPTPAIAWVRQSTIWPTSAEVNYEFIPSFKQNLK